MTELETFQFMLERAGVFWTMTPGPTNVNVQWRDRCHHILRVSTERTSPSNLGYTGFYTEFFWDIDGNLLGMGAWE